MSYLKELARNFQCSQEVQPPQADPSLTASTALTVRPNHPTGLERKIAGWSDAEKKRIQLDAQRAVVRKGGPTGLPGQ